MTWLVFTASSRARARAHCCGNHAPCLRYSCDMAWDIVLVLFWALMLALMAANLHFVDHLVRATANAGTIQTPPRYCLP